MLALQGQQRTQARRVHERELGQIDQQRLAVALRELNIAVAFISAAGVTLEHGLTTSRSALADTLNAAAAAASTTVGLLDSGKFGRSSLLSIRPAQALDLLITDDGLPSTVAAEYRAAGVRLELAALLEREYL